MDALESVAPQSLMYADPQKSILSNRRTVSIRPMSGNKETTCSNSTRLQFRLPNVGVLKSCYLAYKIKPTKSGSAGDVEFNLDPYAGSSSPFGEVIVKSSDGSEINRTSNYNRWCSIYNRFTKSKQYAENEGSINERNPCWSEDRYNIAMNEEALSGNAESADTVKIRSIVGALDAHKRMSVSLKSGSSYRLVHEFCENILSNDKGYALPLFALGSGLTLEIVCNNKEEVFRVSHLTTATVGDTKNSYTDVPTDNISSYDLEDIQLVCDLGHYESSVQQSISEMICDGLKFVVPSVRSQIQPVQTAKSTYILNTHGRSVDAVIGGARNSGDVNADDRDAGSYYEVPDGDKANKLAKVQAQVGSETTPSFVLEFGAMSYHELMKAFKAIDRGTHAGGQVSLSQYTIDGNGDDNNSADDMTPALRSGTQANVMPPSSLFGFGLRSNPELPNSVLAGRTSSSGSIPLSVDVEFDSFPQNTELEFYTISSSVVELLSDGGVLVSK